MRRIVLVAFLIALLTPALNGQSIKIKGDNHDDLALKKLNLLSDLQVLETESTKLDKVLARALAKAEIADAAWVLDQLWAKKLLREAYESTFPEEEEQNKLRNEPVGAAPKFPTDIDRARSEVRNRVFSVASRDKDLIDELTKLGAEKLGHYEEHLRNASLATKAIEAGDKEAASRYILRSIEADPTQISAGRAILDLAAKDRATADALIIQYIERLRTAPPSFENQSLGRTYLILNELVFPNPNRNLMSPGPAVMRAYAAYVIESLRKLEQLRPGFLTRARGILLTAWLPLRKYEPELTEAFLALERLSRSPGGDATLPKLSDGEASKERYERRLRDALDSDQPDELAINFAITRGDFDKARRLIEKLSDGPQKTQLREMANTQEAVSLAKKGNLVEAERLAEQLNKATSILQVYPLIINKYVASKDQPSATLIVYRAINQLKQANSEAAIPPAGIPSSVMVTSRELDPVLVSLSKLAKAVISMDEPLALEILDETVRSANASKMNTGLGRTGIDIDVFRKLTSKNEIRVRQAAESLKDPLRRIVALAEIYQWEAEELEKIASRVIPPDKEATIKPGRKMP
ncbi:MAG: hypothetical protein QOJ64_4566 [Acidobacteriota bacterium]|nr:hypothetical protein [Acidobacteriota bacterium]